MFRNTNRYSFNKTIHVVKRGQIRISLPKQAKFCLKSNFEVGVVFLRYQKYMGFSFLLNPKHMNFLIYKNITTLPLLLLF